MSNWKPLSEFINFSIKGITPKYVDKSNILVLNQKCIRNSQIDYSLARYTDDSKNISSDKFVQKGDILVNSTGAGTAGRSAFVDEMPKGIRLIVDSHILILRCNSFYEAQCLSFILFSFEEKLMKFLTGSSGQSELDKVILLNLLTQMPRDPVFHKKISTKLSYINKKIELNNKINSELEAMAKTLYDYWFVQFDFPNEEGKPYKSSGGAMEWNEELKREIPLGWEVKELERIADIKKGTLITEKTADETGKIKVVSAGLDFSYFHSLANREKNTITISASGANAGFINFWREPIYACDCTTVRGKSEEETLILLNHLRWLQDYICSQARGSAQPHVYPQDITVLKMAIPPTNLVEKYGEMAISFNEKISKNQKENQELASLRDWLLPMLMNGQVSVE